MLTGIKLVQNTHCFLQCWYRSSLVIRRKTNANKNHTGTKYTLLLTILVQNQSGIAKKKKINANKNQTGAKYTLLLTMLVQNKSGIQKKKKSKQKSNQCKSTHWFLQCWYRTTLVFRRKQMRTGIKLVQKYTLVTIICCYRTSLVL